MTRFLLVPGRGQPFPDSWQYEWVRNHPEFQWAPEPPGPPYVARERVAALHEAISADDGPAILVAHSAGCLTVAVWAGRHVGPVKAALLVTPPHLEPDRLPRGPLPFRSVVVASRNDPHSTFAQFEARAREWGSDLVDAGEVGHLDSKTGFGPWPEGERLARSLAVG